MGQLIRLFVLSCLFAVSVQYELGQNYVFDYESTLVMADQHKQVITSQVIMTAIWKDGSDPGHQILRIGMNKPQLHVMKKGESNPAPHSSDLDTLPQHPSYVELNSKGEIVDYWGTEDESVTMANLKRSLASLLQYQVESGDRTEHDASGVCKTSYSREGWYVTKVKKSCYSDSGEFPRAHIKKMMGVDVQSNRKVKIELRKDLAMFQSLEAEETLDLALSVPSYAKSTIQTKQKLVIKSENDGSKYVVSASSKDKALQSLQSTVPGLKTQKISLQLETVSTKEDLADVVKSLLDLSKKNKGSVSVQKTHVLLKLVHKLRTTSKEDLDKILKNNKFKNILPDIIDAVAIVNSPPLIGSVIANLNFKSDELDMKERFLMALSTVPRPVAKTLVFIQKLATRDYPNNEKLQQSIYLTLATMTRKFSTYAQTDEEKKILTEVRDIFLSKLKACSQEECVLLSLRHLQNLALPELVDVLSPYLNERSDKVVAEALVTLQEIPVSHLNDKVKRQLEDIYHQVKRSRDATVRVIAVDILLNSNPSVEVLERLLGSLRNENGEVQTYMLTKLHDVASQNEGVRTAVMRILRTPSIGNYYTLIPSGKSAFLKNSLFETQDVNSSYSFVMETAGGGILKRSVLDLSLDKDSENLNLIRFQIATAGLASLAGVETEGEGEEEEATAALKLTVMGSHLRPYVLFTGQGELMGLVWSGAGSEPTKIVQGNFVLHDHYDVVPLQNGFVARVGAIGAASFDMTGSVTHSLWNRNADISIVNSVAVVIHGSIQLQSPVVTSSSEFVLSTEAKLTSNTAVEFAESPFKMCTKMSQKPVTERYTRTTYETIPQHKYSLRHKKRRTTTHQGKTLALHSKLSEMCSAMGQQ